MASSVPLSKANTSFSLDLLKQLSDKDKAGNVFFSPFSISSALAMVMLGARGNTATQMSEVLHFIETQKPQQAESQRGTQTRSAMESQIQTRLQMQSQIQQTSRLPQYLLKAFLSETKMHYKAELESVDFKSSAQEARVNINSWVEKQTQSKIIDLLSPEMLDSSTMLVLVNAIYFKGNWNKQFEVDSTVDAQFKLNKNDTKPVKMMRQKSKFPIATIPEINCQILEMPYEGKDLSMLIFLPNEMEDDTTGLEKLEKELTYDKFVEWTSPDLIGQTEVEVGLPRFKLEDTYDLNDVLKSMGMVDAFEGTKSDFSGMSPANDLVLSKVVHKAFVEVNEEGTEAAAATGAIMNERSVMVPTTFIADHPFLFFIRHKTTRSIFFAGRYCTPE
uniref:Leukocyte elastase inhibitor n=1 Tax=Scophthalmus maximus TaxID=52904 RepID=A0A8D3DSJ3_SCOMX